MRGSIEYQAKIAVNHVYGISVSKKETRLNSALKGQNGHNVSDLIHANRTKDQFINLTKSLLKFQKQMTGKADLHAISGKIVKDFVQTYVDKGLNYNSISTYISQLEKLNIAINKIEDRTPERVKNIRQPLFNRSDLITARANARTNTTQKVHENRAYTNVNSIHANIKNPQVSISYQLQSKYGLRVAAATRIQSKQLSSDGKFTFKNKGGKVQTIKLDKDTFVKLNKSIKENNGHFITYKSYAKDLKQAVLASGQQWQGTHGLRYSYAQSRVEKYRSSGMSNYGAKIKVSHELGHNRADITEHYLK